MFKNLSSSNQNNKEIEDRHILFSRAKDKGFLINLPEE